MVGACGEPRNRERGQESAPQPGGDALGTPPLQLRQGVQILGVGARYLLVREAWRRRRASGDHGMNRRDPVTMSLLRPGRA